MGPVAGELNEMAHQHSRISIFYLFCMPSRTSHDWWVPRLVPLVLLMTGPTGCGRKQNEMKRQNFQIPVFFFLVCLARLVMTGGTSRGTINEKMICQQL